MVRILFVTAACAILACLLWWVLGRSPSEQRALSPGPPASAAPSAPAAAPEAPLEPERVPLDEATAGPAPAVELGVPPSGRIEGHVLRETGASGGCEVVELALFDEGTSLAMSRSSISTLEVGPPNYRFVFEGLGSDRTFALYVFSPGCLGEERGGLHIPPGATLHVELWIRAFARVEGLVLTTSGDPIPRASVRAIFPEPQVIPLSASECAFTDDEGRFRLTELRPGSILLEAQAPLHQEAAGGRLRPQILIDRAREEPARSWLSWTHAIGVAAPGSTIAVTLLAPEVREIVARVVWPDGRPAVGADFQASLPHLGEAHDRAGVTWGTLDETAELIIAVAEAGHAEILVYAEAEDGSLWFAQWRKSEADPVPASPLELVLARGRDVAVQIVDDRRQLLERGRLRWMPRGAGWLTLDERVIETVPHELRLPVPAGGGLWLRASHAESPAVIAECEWRDGEAEPVRLLVPRPCGIRGEVVGMSSLGTSTVRALSRWRTPAGGDAQREISVPIEPSGSFAFDGLPAGWTLLWIEGRPHDAIELELSPGETRAGIRLQF